MQEELTKPRRSTQAQYVLPRPCWSLALRTPGKAVVTGYYILAHIRIDAKEIISNSKHAWILHLWPTFASRRPWEMAEVTPQSARAWTKLGLSEHLLEIELGRMESRFNEAEGRLKGTSYELRVCKACKKKYDRDIVEDEKDILSTSTKMTTERGIQRWKIVDPLLKENKMLFEEVFAMDADSTNTYSLLSRLHELEDKKAAEQVWDAMGLILHRNRSHEAEGTDDKQAKKGDEPEKANAEASPAGRTKEAKRKTEEDNHHKSS